MKKKLLAWTLSGIMLFTALPMSAMPVLAADAASGSGTAQNQNTETVYGNEETVSLSSSSGRNRDFDEGWKFYRGTNGLAQNTNYDDSSWTKVTLPHDFSINQDFTTSGEAESGFLPGGTGWYRKHFIMPESDKGKSVVLHFDGAYNNTTVYVNGTKVGENHYGYNSFDFDITKELKCDGTTDNVVAVQVVNQIPSSRWYSGSGIDRDVELVVTDPVHVVQDGISITTPDISSGSGKTDASVEVKNDTLESKNVTVQNVISNADGTKVAESSSQATQIPAGATSEVATTATVANPKLWSPDSPALYTMKTEVSVDGAVTDTKETKFGYRYTSFDKDKGFYLNGQPVKLNGVCLHQDQGALGSAQEYDALYRQIMKMKDMGANCIRTSHGIADPKLIEICDQVGMMVMEEAFDGWTAPKNGNSHDFSEYFSKSVGSDGPLNSSSNMTWGEYALKSMIRRDKNSPAVIIWDLGNEVSEDTPKGDSDSTLKSTLDKLISWTKQEDTTRPVTIGSNRRGTSGNFYEMSQNLKNAGGIPGYNYARINKNRSGSASISQLHTKLDSPIISTETSSATNSRGFYNSKDNNRDVDNGKYHLTSYDTSTVGWGLTAHDSMWNTLTTDYVAGEFVWTGFDYIGEPTPWNGTGSGGSQVIPNSSYFGIVDTAGFEKDTYYLYRSQWNQNDTTLHLVTAWDPNNQMTTAGKTPVAIYTNAPVVKLYRNGTEIGTATRKVNTTSAGHTYYTYTTKVADGQSSVCTAVSGKDSTSLYAEFNVAYEKGTISAKAFEADETTEIPSTVGKSSVTTPGTVAKLKVTPEKASIAADGKSFAYVDIEAEDTDGNFVTTADNELTLSLTGKGSIAGVDNGDEATTQKYQNLSALPSSTTAKIYLFRGKALAIVRSTKDAGTITLNASSDGTVSGGSASVVTTAVPKEEQDQDALASYTLIRDYSVKAGVNPSLKTEVTGTKVNGEKVTGTVTWDSVPETMYQKAGDYSIHGTVHFDGYDDIAASAKLHVIPDVIAMRNISGVTAVGKVPSLPDTVRGVLADGKLSGEFSVKWDKKEAGDFNTAGQKVVVEGTATVLGSETLPVTATIRVAEPVTTTSTNVAGSAHLSQGVPETMQSDNLNTLTDGKTAYDDNTSYRWTNWKNRNNNTEASVTLSWDTAQMISSVNLYFFKDNGSAQLPKNVEFEYSLNGTDFKEIGYKAVTPTAGFTKTEYVFNETINPIAIRITLTEQSGQCVGLTEVEAMTAATTLNVNKSADLKEIDVDGKAVNDFASGTTEYTVEGGEKVTAAIASDENAGVTILPVVEDSQTKNRVVKILTVSEDGSASKTYTVTLTEKKASTEQKVPKVTLKATKGASGKIKLTAQFEDYTHQDSYYKVTEHGFVYKFTPNFYGHHILLVTTPGRTKVRCKNFKTDGSYVYSMKPANANAKYEIKAYLTYQDKDGRTMHTYSDAVWTNLNDLDKKQ